MANKKQKENNAPDKSVFYSVVRWLVNISTKIFFPSRCIGKEKFNRKNPYIIVSTHQSFIDPVLIAAHNKWHQIRFLGKSSLRNFFLLRWIVDGLGMIPVVRHATDISAMRECLKALKNQNVLCIFPEGTRKQTHELNDLASGVGLIALKSQAPIIPLYFDRKPRLFRRTNIYVGDEIFFEDLIPLGTGKDNCANLMERIRLATIELAEVSKASKNQVKNE
ncbi:MAG: lysophospholipid acyltransferase family protein [Eubacteriales bacterium]|nr:lysophospholipid acyltransferase family protein [Eubacteriales bacterium]